VIIPAYNSQATVARCLDALEQQTLPRDSYEIIVVDDGSTANTNAQVRAYDNVRLLVQVHAGPAAARNLGVEHARGEIVLFTDADCEPAADWVEQMLAPLDVLQTAGVKGVYRTQQRALVARFVQMEYETRYQRMTRHMARHGRIDFVDTYAAAYRRDVFLAAEGFDPKFAKASVEDQELSFRIAEQGHRLVFAPQAAVFHWGHATTAFAYAWKKCKIAFYKIEVLKQHSSKAWQDAHTPQRLKAQILILGIGLCSLLPSLVWPSLLWVTTGCGVLFFLTTIPFVAKAWKQDPSVAVVSPLLLLLRALALGSGMAAGVFYSLYKSATGREPR